MIANRRRAGTTSRRSSTFFPTRSGDWRDRPVTLLPGRARFATKPLPTGSNAIGNTMGMTEVARMAAATPFPPVTMTSTFRRTNSVAISAIRSLRPSAQRTSIARLRPSTQPSSRNRCTKAATQRRQAAGVVVPRNPIVDTLAGCWACARSGHAAAAPPMSVMNSRRFIQSPRRRLPAASSALQGRGLWRSSG